jgi:predicted amidohydrolase
LTETGTITIRPETSTLQISPTGKLSVRVVQCATGIDPITAMHRTGLPIGEATEADITRGAALLTSAPEGGLTAIGWHPGLRAQRWTTEGTVAAGLGQHDRRDEVRVVGPGGVDLTIAKTCLSKNDREANLLPGNEIIVFEKPKDRSDEFVSWAVLNCFEYTHPGVIGELEARGVEVVVVLTANIASRLYREYATADVHRLFSYVVIANIAECGGSGIYGPIRRRGAEKGAQMTVAGEVISARGPGEVILEAELAIGDLRASKQAFGTDGFKAIDQTEGLDDPASMMVPSQRYIDTGDGVGCGAVVASVPAEPVRLEWHDGDVVTIGVAQLRSIAADRYAGCEYRLDTSPWVRKLERELDQWLRHATELRSDTGRRLDMLLLPEVFVPRSLVGRIRDFATHQRCTVIAGFDYPAKPGPNANECAVFPRDGSKEHWYRKVTRSQYDGLSPWTGSSQVTTRIPIQRGDSLLRFESAEGRSFGVLICYDFSHVALMNQINLEGRDEPLELMAVVAHNPFGQLYRSGCIADSHRYYQYIAMCNVATYGGSGVFAPMRRPGWRQVLAEVGPGTEAIAVADIDLGRLRNGRLLTLDDSDREQNRNGKAGAERAWKQPDPAFMDPSAVMMRSCGTT